jgi:ribosome recycling factor
MIDPIKKDATAKMVKTLDALKTAFTKLRTGRANAGILDHIMVDYYGSPTQLSQVASVVVEDARTISITPWEKPMVVAIEKAIMKSDLGITPNTAGMAIRINLPPLTEERRKDLVKVVKGETETARISIRNARRDAMQAVKDLLKNKQISENDEKRAETDIQKLTDLHIAKADEMTAAKEKELLSM